MFVQPSAADAQRNRVSAMLENFAKQGSPVTHRWCEYEPELDRYGGLAGLRIAELLFQGSSDFVSAILEHQAVFPLSARFGFAATSMLTVFHELRWDAARVRDFLRRYALSWLSRNAGSTHTTSTSTAAAPDAIQANVTVLVRRVWDALSVETDLPLPFGNYRACIRQLRTAAEVACAAGVIVQYRKRIDTPDFGRAMVPSYVHMTNNRLGLSTMDEARVALLMAEAMDLIVKGDGDA